jgi:NADH dehydrogenase
MGFSFSGFLAWWAWRTIYVSKLPGLQKKLRVVMDWTFDLFFPRDINLLSPQYSKPLKYIHLEAGDSLFYPGEPAFSVYFVREGTIEIRDGDQLIKSVNPGEYFGERAILSDQVWHYQAVASKASELVAIGAPEFRAIVEGSTALESLFKRSAMAYGSQKEFDKLKERLDPKIFSARVSDLMIQNPHTLSAGMTFQEALKAFREHSHGSYPVLDDKGGYAGVLKRDALYDAIKSSGLDSGNRVGDLPLNRPPLIQETATGEELLERMNRSGKNKLIVTDENGAFKGLVTVVDILDHGLNK